MSRVEAAAADRLPWLSDEPQPQPAIRRRGHIRLAWGAGAFALIAAGGIWYATQKMEQPGALPPRAQPATTVHLPAPRTAQPDVRLPVQPEIKPVAVAEVQPAPTREIRISAPPQERAAKVEEKPSATESEAKPAAPAAVTAPRSVPKPWNPRVFAGAAGRLVQVGAFGSVRQAKSGWWYMVRAYPAMSHLPAVVRPSRNSRGRTFYRFQVGTTSQAHSEVLCQRMEHIRFSCAVVGLPWKAKVER